MYTENPVKKAREAHGLTRTQFAHKLGITYAGVSCVELGRVAAVSESWRAGLTALGFDFEALGTEYRAWRLSLAAIAAPVSAHG